MDNTELLQQHVNILKELPDELQAVLILTSLDDNEVVLATKNTSIYDQIILIKALLNNLLDRTAKHNPFDTNIISLFNNSIESLHNLITEIDKPEPIKDNENVN